MERRSFIQKSFFGAAVAGTGLNPVHDMYGKEYKSNFNIVDYGAKGDQKTVNTIFIQKAIDAAAANGGGKVIVPPGIYLSGTIELKSNIILELMVGAVLMPSPDINDIKVYEKTFALSDMAVGTKRRHFIYTRKASNVSINGGGTISGNKAHMNKKKNDYTWFGTMHHDFSPFIEWEECDHIRIENIKITETPGWDCHFYNCDKIWIRGVEILNDVYAGHSDGFDISGCRDVMISDCHISTGDDAIVLKTPRFSRSCERITVNNCVLRSNCAAFKLGTDSWHDFRQITFTNSVVYQSSRAFQIVSFDGGDTSDVIVDNIICDTNAGLTMPRAIHLDIHKRDVSTIKGEYPEQKKLGTLRNISITNVKINTDGRILLTAEEGCKIENVILRDIHVEYPWIEDPEFTKDKTDRMQCSNFSPDARTAYAVVIAKNIDKLQLSGLTIQWPNGKIPENYLPKAEKGVIILDPKNSPLPPSGFHAFWGKNIRKGILDIPLAESSDNKTKKIHLENCDIIVK